MRVVLFLLLGVLVIGCGPKKKEVTYGRAGDAAPEYTGNIGQFIVGKWTMTEHIDANFAKQLGASELVTPSSEQEVEYVFDFQANNTFTFRDQGDDYTIGGKWVAAGETVRLEYTTLDGKPLNQAREELQKAAEGGTRGAIRNEIMMDFLFNSLVKLTDLRVGSNKRMLSFGSGASSGSLDLSQLAGPALERLVAQEGK